jgi:putative ABC transport system permease protein
MLYSDTAYGALGDLEEQFNEIARRDGLLRARLYYWSQVAAAMPGCIGNFFYWSVVMLKNYLTVAVRNISRHKTFSLINIMGLAVGMACCILIAVYILTELGYDRYHENADRICRLEAVLTLGTQPNLVASTNMPPSLAMREDYPEVVDSCRFLPFRRSTLVAFEDKQYYEEKIYYGEETVFDIFTYPMILGDPKTALTLANSIVLTEDIANKYFGGEDPMGKVLKLNNTRECTVTGVIENVPPNSHFKFTMLISFQTLREERTQFVEAWAGPFGSYGYVLLDEGADYRQINEKLPAMVDKYMGESLKNAGVDVEYFLTPITEIHLHSDKRHEAGVNSDIKYVYIFAVVAAFILLMACVNFMNLATARSSTRAREIGMRKVLGASRGQVVRQFFGESMLYSFVSLVIAMILVHLTLPVFSSLANRDLTIDYSAMPWLIPALIGLALLVGLLAGSYPALVLSRFQPIRVLRAGAATTTSKSAFRKVLVVAQFAISITLLIGTSVVIGQLNFMRDKDLGFDKENVVTIPLNDRSLVQSVNSIMEEVGSYERVLSVATSSHHLGGHTSGASLVPEGSTESQAQMMNIMNIDENYLSMMKMELASGRNFSKSFATDSAGSVIVNEAAVREIGWDDPLGKTIRFSGDDSGDKWTVVGVVKDFHYVSPHMVVEPLLITNDTARLRSIFVRISPEDTPGTLAWLENKWKEFDPDRPFEYSFLDETYNEQYRTEEKLQSIFVNFTLFAIFVACLGLFGLASFSAEQRTKEIGIRKVLGSSVGSIVLLLSRQFAKWVLIANLIAWPLAWYLANKWLEDFAYRVSVGPSVFLLAGLLALIIALVTVSFQAFKAASADPVESLRYE